MCGDDEPSVAIGCGECVVVSGLHCAKRSGDCEGTGDCGGGDGVDDCGGR